MSEPSPISDTLVWCDLETTGTEDEDIILEVAIVVTDNSLDEIGAFNSLVIDCNPKSLIPNTVPRSKDSDIPCWENHFETGLVMQLMLESNMDTIPTVRTVQDKILRFLSSHGIVAGMLARPPLCGSSVQFDRRFLGRYMPEVLKVLHYRNIDVSTVRELQKRWSPEMTAPEKKNAHRAGDDIRESIGLLRSMRASGFVGQPMQEAPLSLHGTACEAAASAVAFTTDLARVYTEIAVGLRQGHTHAALSMLAMSAGDLDFLLKFLDLVGDSLVGMNDATAQAVKLYRSRISGSLDSLHLALDSGNLISLADIIVDDVVEAFKSYGAIDGDVQAALAAALAADISRQRKERE